MDELPQFQVICAVEKISEAYLLPVLETIMAAFPFVILGFHSDSGSEYINLHGIPGYAHNQVAKLLEKLRIEQTKSRSRQTNDNALRDKHQK